MKKAHSCWMLIAGIIFITSCSSQKTEYVIDVGEKIYHGDTEYSVTSYMVTRFLKSGSDTLHARGMFYIIRFRVENKGSRKSHDWDSSIAYIVDDKAGTFENNPEIQERMKAIEPYVLKEKYNTPPGSADSTCLVFDLPFNATMPYLKIKGTMLFSDYLEGALFRRVRVRLF